MNQKKRCPFWVIAFLYSAPLAAHAAQNLAFRGVVSDLVGAVIPHAHVLVRSDISGGITAYAPYQMLVTDISGHFNAKVGKGFYDICIMADAFTPTCRKVFVDGPNAKEEQFRLQVDPKVLKQIADIF